MLVALGVLGLVVVQTALVAVVVALLVLLASEIMDLLL